MGSLSRQEEETICVVRSLSQQEGDCSGKTVSAGRRLFVLREACPSREGDCCGKAFPAGRRLFVLWEACPAVKRLFVLWEACPSREETVCAVGSLSQQEGNCL